MSRRRYRSDYLEESESSFPVQDESVTVSETVYGTIVNASCVKVRESPSADAPVIAFMNRGSKVLVDPSFEGMYRKVLVKGLKTWCYILSDYCEVKDNGNNNRH